MQLTKIFDFAYGIDGDTINIEQDMGYGEVHAVQLHPIHVRLLAGELGLLRGDPDAWRLVESLSRKLRLLCDRCEHLERWLYVNSDSDHADLSYEQTFAEATADLAREFCAELPQYVRAEPKENPAGLGEPAPSSGKKRRGTPSVQPSLGLEAHHE